MRWAGFRRVRQQVCRRIRARYTALGLSDHAAYRSRLENDDSEWPVLDKLCRVTISRFFRNRRVFEEIPALAAALAEQAGERALRVWSAGCASGEEPYGVALALRDMSPPVEIVATDADPHMLERARRASYSRGTLRELDDATVARAFEQRQEAYVLQRAIRDRVRFVEQDVRRGSPDGLFDLVLCRNIAFTYFDQPTQLEVVERFATCTVTGGALIVGTHEHLPDGASQFLPWAGRPHTFKKQP
jgi:chemotaxis protein methyltransferase CheR